MAFSYTTFASTPATLTADLKTNILLSSDWSNITGDIVKATTTRGAQLVLNLAKVAANAQRLGLSAWRTHNGTTGVDESPTCYLNYHFSTGATSDVLHCAVSASKEHLFVWVEGPVGAETNATNATGQSLFLGDLVPYHASDAVPAAVLVASNTTNTNGSTDYALVSRDQGDVVSWVSAVLATLSPPSVVGQSVGVTAAAKGDGKTYLWPYVVIECQDGLRGRLGDVFFGGWRDTSNVVDMNGQLGAGASVSYGSKTYTLLRAWRSYATSSAVFSLPWGRGGLGTTGPAPQAPLLAVRTA